MINKIVKQLRLHPLNICCCCNYPSFSLGRRYGTNGNSGSCVNVIKFRLGERWQPISNQSQVTSSPTTNNANCHWWVPKSRLLRHARLNFSFKNHYKTNFKASFEYINRLFFCKNSVLKQIGFLVLEFLGKVYCINLSAYGSKKTLGI